MSKSVDLGPSEPQPSFSGVKRSTYKQLGPSDRKRGYEGLQPTRRVQDTDNPDLVGSLLIEEDKPGRYGFYDIARHAPCIDIDMPCRLEESSPGRFHLFIDRPLRNHEYEYLLKGMLDAGIIERGFYNSWKDRGQTMLYLPGKKVEVSMKTVAGEMER